LPKFYCIQCPWIGFNPVVNPDPEYRYINIESCPKCGWVVYNEHDAGGMKQVYPILREKLLKK
jgi:hypothetical protein